jgi:hypothetical protein
MPYITSEDREYASFAGGNNPGHLNYFFTNGIQQYIKTKGLSYQTINDIIGALEGAKMEFYRRIAVPYEDVKKDLNGDVYE